MTENKRFWVENERILNTYVLRIFKDEEIIFEVNNWNSLNETNKVECEEIVNELNKLSDENEALKSTEMEYEDALGRLEEENAKLKNDGISYYLNETLVEDIKTLLVVLAFCEFPKTNRLSIDEFGAIARLQGFLCENIIDLEELKKELGE